MIERAIPQTFQANELDNPRLTFIEGSDLQHLLDDIGFLEGVGFYTEWRKEITGALTHQENGMWDEVWLTENSHPHRLSAIFHNRAYYGLKL